MTDELQDVLDSIAEMAAMAEDEVSTAYYLAAHNALVRNFRSDSEHSEN